MIGTRSVLLAATNSESYTWSNYLVAASGMNGTSGGSILSGSVQNVFNQSFDDSVTGARGTTLLFTPPSPIPFNTSLQVIGMEPGVDQVILNGSTILTADSNGTVTFTGPGSLVTLREYDRNGEFEVSMMGIYVDYLPLIDGFPVGYNPYSSANYLTGAWIPYLVAAAGGGTSGGSFWASFPNPTHGFDLSQATAVGAAVGSSLLFTPPSPIPFSSTLKVYVTEPGYDSAVLNGTTVVVSDGSGVITFSGPGSLVSLRIQDRPPNYYNAAFTRIEVDGKLMLHVG